MEALWQDLRYGFRVLAKKPGFAAIAVLTLALGIGANAMIFSVIDAVLLRPLPYAEPERLVMLAETKEEVPNRWVSYPNFRDWQERSQSFEAMSTIRGWATTLTGGGEPERLNARLVAADYFNVMRVRPLLGRGFLPEEDRAGTGPVTILSHGFWRQRFGSDPGVIGRSVTLDGRGFTVVGVMPESFQHQGPPPLWVLIGQQAKEGWMQRDVRVAGYVVARLRPGVTLARARSEMEAVGAELDRQYPYANAGHHIRVVPLLENIVGESRALLLMLSGAVGLVLLISCANVANLLLVRGAMRGPEIAIRTALGASRWRVTRQLIGESLLLCLLGGAAGVMLAWWGAELLLAAEPNFIPRLAGVRIDWRVMGFTFGLALLTGEVCGLVPAWQASRIGLHEMLKEGGRTATDGRGGRLRKALVVAEVALALVLLIGAGLLIKSLARLLESQPGFDARRVQTMIVGLPEQKYPGREQVRDFHRQLLERVAGLPGVERASISNNLPGLPDGWQTDINPEPYRHIRAGEEINVDWGIVSPDYFTAMGIPVLQGRSFTRQEAEAGAHVVLVDEHLARQFWPDGQALGKHIKYDSATPQEIVGIVGNVKNYGSEALPRIKIYTPYGRSRLRGAALSLKLTRDEVPGLIEAVTREVRALDKDVPITEVARLEELLAREAAPRRVNAVLLGSFALIALLLAAVGIYGVMSYAVEQRTAEIGIRMALGAERGEVLRFVLGQGMRLILAGVGVGLVAALGLTRLIAGLLYGVGASDPATYGVVAVVLGGVGLLACWVPALRATRVDPLVALRHQ